MSTDGLNNTITSSSEETIDFGKKLIDFLPPSPLLCLYGHLGSGKTTLIKGIVTSYTGLDTREIQSPTFNLLNIYEGTCIVYHFDLYRLKGPEEFEFLGFNEYLQSSHPVIIEWAERITSLLPKRAIKITLSAVGATQRKIDYETFRF